MWFRSLVLSSVMALIAHSTEVRAVGWPAVMTDCNRLNEEVLTRAANGGCTEAERTLEAGTAHGKRLDSVCAGLILANVASLLMVSGRFEGETVAERSVRILEGTGPSDHPALLRPLQLLARVRFARGKTGRAREVLTRMQLIRIHRPEDRSAMRARVAAFLQAEGKWREAAAELSEAIRSLQEAGYGETADAGTLLLGLGWMHMKERLFDEARQAIDEAATIFERSANTVPMDPVRGGRCSPGKGFGRKRSGSSCAGCRSPTATHESIRTWSVSC